MIDISISKLLQIFFRDFKVILNVLGSLKQRVLMKFDKDSYENLPSNIKISKWLPQQDILAHPKTRLFVTHGGLFSTQEANYFGVPLVGMPLFTDQLGNMKTAAVEGWAVLQDWNNLTETNFKLSINKALNDQR